MQRPLQKSALSLSFLFDNVFVLSKTIKIWKKKKKEKDDVSANDRLRIDIRYYMIL